MNAKFLLNKLHEIDVLERNCDHTTNYNSFRTEHEHKSILRRFHRLGDSTA